MENMLRAISLYCSQLSIQCRPGSPRPCPSACDIHAPVHPATLPCVHMHVPPTNNNIWAFLDMFTQGSIRSGILCSALHQGWQLPLPHSLHKYALAFPQHRLFLWCPGFSLAWLVTRGDYRRQQHYHNSITIIDKLSQYYHDSSFDGNLKKQELMLVQIAF